MHSVCIHSLCVHHYDSTGIGPDGFAFVAPDGPDSGLSGLTMLTIRQLGFYLTHGFYITSSPYILRQRCLNPISMLGGSQEKRSIWIGRRRRQKFSGSTCVWLVAGMQGCRM